MIGPFTKTSQGRHRARYRIIIAGTYTSTRATSTITSTTFLGGNITYRLQYSHSSTAYSEAAVNAAQATPLHRPRKNKFLSHKSHLLKCTLAPNQAYTDGWVRQTSGQVLVSANQHQFTLPPIFVFPAHKLGLCAPLAQDYDGLECRQAINSGSALPYTLVLL